MQNMGIKVKTVEEEIEHFAIMDDCFVWQQNYWKLLRRENSLECSNCDGKMVKWKYLHYEELENYLLNENKMSADMRPYEEWLRTLQENDVVLTLFKREDYSGIKEKYYIRVVERTTKNGIKLRHLTKIFRYGAGEIAYRKGNPFPSTTIYKIVPIDKQVDKIIRKYCKDEEEFDIDKINKIITRTLKEQFDKVSAKKSHSMTGC